VPAEGDSHHRSHQAAAVGSEPRAGSGRLGSLRHIADDLRKTARAADAAASPAESAIGVPLPKLLSFTVRNRPWNWG